MTEDILQCQECGFIGPLDAFDMGGADGDCLFCNQCSTHINAQTGLYQEPRPEDA